MTASIFPVRKTGLVPCPGSSDGEPCADVTLVEAGRRCTWCRKREERIADSNRENTTKSGSKS